jgi:hypothetical protein
MFHIRLLSGAGTVGQLVTAVRIGLSLTLPLELNKLWWKPKHDTNGSEWNVVCNEVLFY